MKKIYRVTNGRHPRNGGFLIYVRAFTDTDALKRVRETNKKLQPNFHLPVRLTAVESSIDFSGLIDVGRFADVV